MSLHSEHWWTKPGTGFWVCVPEAPLNLNFVEFRPHTRSMSDVLHMRSRPPAVCRECHLSLQKTKL